MDIGKVFKDSFSTLKRQYLFLLVVVILIFSPYLLRTYIGNTSAAWTLVSSLLKLFFWNFAFLFLLSRMRRVKLTKEEIIKFLKCFWRVIICHLILFLITVIGILLFVVPGIYMACKYFYCGVIVWDSNCKIGEAFRESARITMGNKFELFIIMVFTFLMSLLQMPFFKSQMNTPAGSLQFDLMPTVLCAITVLLVLPLNLSLYLNAYETMKNSGDDLQ